MAIIDFSFPNLMPGGWRVKVVKETLNGHLKTVEMPFKTKQEAFEYYEMIQSLWRNQKTR